MINYRSTRAEINLQHLKHNVVELRRLAGAKAFFCPMVKADAYGHGAVSVAKALAEIGVQQVGVVLVEEGIELRRAGVSVPILVFAKFNRQSAMAMVEHQLTPVITCLEDLNLFDEVVKPKSRKISVHIKVNTGMQRLGLDEMDLRQASEFLRNCSSLKVIGVCTHLARGESAGLNGSTSLRQIQQFLGFQSQLNLEGIQLHALNSSALVSLYCRAVPIELGARPGISLYGSLPRPDNLQSGPQQEAFESIQLKPVMSIKSRFIRFHQVPAGQGVSYGPTWLAKKQSHIGVLPIGYADGYRRLFSNTSQVLFKGKKLPVVGTVCMDYSMVDLTQLNTLAHEELMNEDVVLMGVENDQVISADQWAEWSTTIPYEVMTGISRRVPRVYKES